MESRDVLLIVEEGTQIWRRQPEAEQVPARHAYCGTAFEANREEAEEKGYLWLILSAKHGFLHPDTVIGEYGESFDHPDSNAVSPEARKAQAVALGLTSYALVMAYGSWRHIARIKATFRGTSVTTGWSIEAQRRASPEDNAER